MTPDEDAAYNRATKLYSEVLANFGWPIQNGVKTYALPWGPPDNIGLQIPGAAHRLTAECAEWFDQRGWIACPFKEEAIVAPQVAVPLPETCYHTTPAFNEDGIRERGLLRGVEAGCSTTDRPDASLRIHVSFEADHAAAWAEDKLLGKHQPGEEWVIFRIDRRGVVGKVFRDPASRQTGYILEARSVAWQYLELVRRWTPMRDSEAKP